MNLDILILSHTVFHRLHREVYDIGCSLGFNLTLNRLSMRTC